MSSELPLPPQLDWVRPRRELAHVRLRHLAVRGLGITLCSRVRPGEKIENPLSDVSLLPDPCPRCLARLYNLYPPGA